MNKKLYFFIVFCAIIFVLYQAKNADFYQHKTTKKTASNSQEKMLNIYSSRKEELMQQVFEKFTNDTGIKINVLVDNAKKLVSKMESEKYSPNADLFLTSDIGNLEYAKEKILLEPIKSEILNNQIPQYYRDKEKKWFGLSKRVRAIFYAKDYVNPDILSTYEDLANEKWLGKILIRSSSNIYNQSLLASIIAANGNITASNWVKGLIANFARNPQGGDTDQIKALAAHEGEIAVANSYYYARLLDSKEETDREIAQKVGIFFPNQNDRGAHINISGAGVVVGAKHKENAIKFLEFLASDEGQKIYAEVNHEYPVVNNVALSNIVASWPQFKQDEKNLLQIAQHLKEAVKIADIQGWR